MYHKTYNKGTFSYIFLFTLFLFPILMILMNINNNMNKDQSRSESSFQIEEKDYEDQNLSDRIKNEKSTIKNKNSTEQNWQNGHVEFNITNNSDILPAKNEFDKLEKIFDFFFSDLFINLILNETNKTIADEEMSNKKKQNQKYISLLD